MTRWLVTGVTGLLGANAALRLGVDSEVVGASRRAPATNEISFIAADLADARSRENLVERSGATAVLHTAALASIEACEQAPERARVLNAEAAGDLAGQAARLGIPFVHISTDAVFDGTRGDYRESDAPSPASAYGRTKLAGEQAVLEAHAGALVARVNFYGWSPSGTRSLAEYFYNRLSQGQQAPGFTDIHVSTLQVGLLIECLGQLVAARASGVLHVVSSEPITKYDFGRRLATTFGFDPDLVVPAQSTDHLEARRGSRLSLRTDRARDLLGRALPDQASGLERLRHERESGLHDHIHHLVPIGGSTHGNLDR